MSTSSPGSSSSTTTTTTTTSSISSAARKTASRKKKAARACVHCQKAHLTCDDARPCQRCTKRGLASTCTDGARKKAKYLQDAEESDTQPRFNALPPVSTTTPPLPPPPLPSLQHPSLSTATSQHTAALHSLTALTPDATMNSFGHTDNIDTSQLLDLNNYNYGFGSTATNLEYSILSSMLGSPMKQLLDSTATTPTTPNALSNLWQAAGLAGGIQTPENQQNSQSPFNNHSINNINSHTRDTRPSTQHHSSNSPSSSPSGMDTVLYSPDQNPMGSPYNNPTTPTTSQQSTSSTVRMSSLSAYGEGAVVAKVDSPNTVLAQVKRRNQLVTPEMVYARATKPFSYADGYHYLINYVQQKMTRQDLMRISRALALFRPSVLASMMNLTEDDLIFTEKCLQRTLLEYEKLISYSGTPTVVWRRTGEITLVGKEFSLLTQWSRDALLSKKTYIYELMSNPSAIEYWEKYSSHAFDNTDSAVYSSCILLSPTKRVVPCTFCFTIKRDIFDLPSVIVGNFLPILS